MKSNKAESYNYKQYQHFTYEYDITTRTLVKVISFICCFSFEKIQHLIKFHSTNSSLDKKVSESVHFPN